MLSYQHLYHAGNLADLHKLAVLAVMLDYLTRKDKSLSYIETHAGRGLYVLDAPEAERTGEAAAGILRVERLGWFAPDHPYARVLAETRAAHGPPAYPGSPEIAARLLRTFDSLHLAELHPREREALVAAMAGRPNVSIYGRDGLDLARSITPPTPRRGLMLVDPSYEVKTDYAAMAKLLRDVHRKWNVGTLVLWYPILASGAHLAMAADLASAGMPGTLVHEVTFPPAREGHGMRGSGLIVINAPYGTEVETARLSSLFAALR